MEAARITGELLLHGIKTGGRCKQLQLSAIKLLTAGQKSLKLLRRFNLVEHHVFVIDQAQLIITNTRVSPLKPTQDVPEVVAEVQIATQK